MDMVTDDYMYQQISTAIFEHRLLPGTRLSEDVLATNFGVSRTRIRKLLQRLAYEQLVMHEPNKGASVARLSLQETQEVFAARRLIESGLIRMIQFPVPKKKIKALEKILKEEKKAHDSHNYRELPRLSGQFHLELAALGGNQTLLQYLEQLIVRTSLAIVMYQSFQDRHCDNDDHDQLIQLLLEEKKDALVALMERHLTNIENTLSFEPKLDFLF